MRLDISVHYAFGVTEVERFKQLVDVVADVVILELRIERSEIGVIDILEYQTGCLALAVSHYIEKSYNVWASAKILKNLDLSLYLLLLDRL